MRDLVLAVVSHLPHLIAYNMVGTAADLEEVTQTEVIKYSASGFRDSTRIAASDVDMWRDIFLNNREAVLEMIAAFERTPGHLAFRLVAALEAFDIAPQAGQVARHEHRVGRIRQNCPPLHGPPRAAML